MKSLNSTGRKNGFTLLEMSMVLLVIALLTGGIVVAKTMVKSSELRAAVGEMQRYKQAVLNFRDKYKALPGDFSEATSLWGSSSSCPAGITTCTTNGDGNGHITDQTVSTYYEQFAAWQHLANANLIEGSFTGTSPSQYNDRVVKTNIPGSQLSGAGWGLLYVYTRLTEVTEPSPVVIYPKHVLWLGGNSMNPSTNQDAMTPVLTPEEALDIDSKIDDGDGGSGNVIAQINLGKPYCLQMGTTSYNVDAYSSVTGTFIKAKPSCSLIFLLGF